jgi:hypothetical protein
VALSPLSDRSPSGAQTDVADTTGSGDRITPWPDEQSGTWVQSRLNALGESAVQDGTASCP